MTLPNWLIELGNYLSITEDFIDATEEVFVIILVTAIIHFFQRRGFKKFLAARKKKHLIWDDAVVYALQKPLGVLIWIVGVTYAAKIVASHDADKILYEWIEPTQLLGMIITVVWSALRLINRLEKHLVNPPRGKTGYDKTSVLAIARILRIAVVVTMALGTLQAFNIPISGLLTLGGAGTLVAGFAAKDLLANLFGGLLLSIERPFAVGDWINSPDREIEGTVEHIGWRLTRIRAFSKRPRYVPNQVFLNITVENPSRMLNRQIKEVIGIRYQDMSKIPTMLKEVEEMLFAHPDLDTNQTTFITMTHFGESTLDCQLYCFTKTTEWVPYLKVQQDVYVKIGEIINKHGADFAFPTRTLDIPERVLVEQAEAHSK